MPQETTPERMFGVGALSSVIAGLVAGIGARIIMRIVAVTAHMPLQFSIAGTLNILFFGLFLGFAVGFLITFFTMAVYSSPKARKYFPDPVWRGLICGILLLLVGLPTLVNSSSTAADFALGIPLLNKCMFGTLIVIYGITLGVAEKTCDHYLPRRPTSTKTDILASSRNEE
jgi:hypothetical protein